MADAKADAKAGARQVNLKEVLGPFDVIAPQKNHQGPTKDPTGSAVERNLDNGDQSWVKRLRQRKNKEIQQNSPKEGSLEGKEGQ